MLAVAAANLTKIFGQGDSQIVALKDARGLGGLLIGTAIGFACAVFIVSRVGLDEPVDNPWTILALFSIPAGASMGFLSAVATGSNKAPQPKPAAAPRSDRRCASHSAR